MRWLALLLLALALFAAAPVEADFYKITTFETPKETALEVGSIEQSNTQAVTAMTDLVTITRNFDAFQRAIDAFRTIDQKVVDNVVGG